MAVEAALWIAVVVLLSPLLIYYPVGAMPLAALFAIAGGIALGLGLTGRRLHASLLDDALSGRDGRGRFLMTFGMALLSQYSRAGRAHRPTTHPATAPKITPVVMIGM